MKTSDHLLLQTKLYIPPARSGLIPRPRLNEKLNAGLNGRLTLVSAPAGFGKTTLVTEWLSQFAGHSSQIAWYSLDKDDNDLHRFFSYVAAALQQIDQIGRSLSSALQAPQPVSAKTLATALIHDGTAVNNPFILVLDDFHLITMPAIHEALLFLIEHMPPQMHLALISRDVPNLPLARLRVRGQMTEIGEADLRFTADEATQFLNQAMGLNLSTSDIATLEARTEGWVAGLQLAAVALSSHGVTPGDDVQAFITSFAGDDQYVFDYLVEEILTPLPTETETFLLQTSILERMCGELCDALTGRQDGQAMLANLQQTNLLVIPLDNKRHWYRYHQLFSDFLRHRLRQTQPDRVRQLHQQATDWYGRHGFTDEAIHHALAAADLTTAAELITAAGWPMLMRGEIPTLRRLLGALPHDFLISQPDLVSLDVAAQFVAGVPINATDMIEAELAQALNVISMTAMPEDQRDYLTGQMLGHRAFIALNAGDIDAGLILCHQALEYAAADDFLLGYIKLGLGIVHRFTGHVEQALQALTESITHSQKVGSTLLTLTGMSNLAELHEVHGELSQAEAVYKQALASARGEGGQPIPVTSIAYLGLAKVLRERNELETAVQYLDQAIALSRLGELAGILIDSLITLALVRRAQQDWPAAAIALDEAEAIVASTGDPTNMMRIGAFQARLQLAQGDEQAPARWAQTYGLTIHDDLEESLEIEHLTLVRILIAAQQPDVALHLLDRLRQQMESAGRRARVIESLVLEALAHQLKGDEVKALTTIERALILAAPEGYVRTFADEGQPVATLLTRLEANRGQMTQFARQLQQTITAEINSLPSVSTPQPLPDPLKAREIQILKLIAAGLSNKEIAAELYLTVGTVKSYTHQLYGKLSVRRRTEAVERARELGIL